MHSMLLVKREIFTMENVNITQTLWRSTLGTKEVYPREGLEVQKVQESAKNVQSKCNLCKLPTNLIERFSYMFLVGVLWKR